MSRRVQPLSIILLLVDLIVVPVSLALASLMRSTLPFGVSGALSGENATVPPLIYILAVVCWAVGMTFSGVYDPQRSLRWFNEIWRVAWGNLLSAFLMAGLLYLTFRELSRLQFVYFTLVSAAAMIIYRGGLRLAYRTVGRARPGGRTRILVVGAGALGSRLGRILLDHSRWGFEPAGYLDDDIQKQGAFLNGLQVLGSISDLADLVQARQIDEVWTALPLTATHRLQDILNALERVPVRVKVVPDYFSMALVQANAQILDGLPIIGLRDPLIEGVPRLVKRVFDISVSLVLLLLLLPAGLVIGLAVRLDSPGPAIISQERVGENGRLFKMLKYRTMLADADERIEEVLRHDNSGQLIHKSQNDPRVTTVGHVLRRFSLDELPQLVNVLKGDMSLVGPRPEMPWLVERYESWQRKRFAVPQGITGWWQINGRSDKPMHLHTEDDLYYVFNYSLWLDILILIRTPWAVIKGKGAF
jgi:exopolysaccharide biosynthesis polyprenyl glycosylphosphotransferase